MIQMRCINVLYLILTLSQSGKGSGSTTLPLAHFLLLPFADLLTLTHKTRATLLRLYTNDAVSTELKKFRRLGRLNKGLLVL